MGISLGSHAAARLVSDDGVGRLLPRALALDWRYAGSRHGRIRAHLLVVVVALPVMLLALALDLAWLFAIAGPIQAIGLGPSSSGTSCR